MKFRKSLWPKKPVRWNAEDYQEAVSIAFSWMAFQFLEEARAFPQKRYLIGGPGVYLTEKVIDWPENVKIGRSYPGVLQRLCPTATRTTIGCPRSCGFCGVRITEPDFVELKDWPEGEVYCDNNITAASLPHFDRVMDRIGNDPADFNQGVDARLLNRHHADRFGRNKKIVIRLALDNDGMRGAWERAYDLLRTYGVAKSRIRSYVLCGFQDTVEDAWARCEFVKDHGSMALPMWFHELTARRHNEVTMDQQLMGWTDFERRRIGKWFYWHQRIVK